MVTWPSIVIVWAPTSDGSKEAVVVCNVGAGEEGKGRRVEEEEKGVEKDRDTGAGAVEDVVWSGGEPAGAVDDRPAEKGEGGGGGLLYVKRVL